MTVEFQPVRFTWLNFHDMGFVTRKISSKLKVGS